MAEFSRLDKVRIGRLIPDAVLDGGGEACAALNARLERLLDELAAGAVLEVITHDPGAYDSLHAWCADAGHAVFRSSMDAQRARFWIEKGTANG